MKLHPAGTVLALALGALLTTGARAEDKQASVDERPAPERLSGVLTGQPPVRARTVIPPVLFEDGGSVKTSAIFPFYFSRTAPDDRERLVGAYYWRRGKRMNADVALGVLWWLRGHNWHTFALPPFYSHHSPDRWLLGLPPLFAAGRNKDRYHTVIPPLLTWISGNKERGRTVIGPYFHVRKKHERWWGLAPLLWGKNDGTRSSVVLPPLFFRFADEARERRTTVVPPFYYRRDGKRRSHGLLPLWSFSRHPEGFGLTVPAALFHYSKDGTARTLITPVMGYFRGKDHAQTFITPIYQGKRGPTGNLDAVAPFFFRTWDDRDASRALVVPPFYWHWEDPASETSVLFPLFGRWRRPGIRTTWLTPLVGQSFNEVTKRRSTWVAPTFQFARSPGGWELDVHPLLYIERGKHHAHNVLAPVWWDFSNDKAGFRRRVAFPFYWDFEDRKQRSRTQIAFPLYWRFDRGARSHRLVLNTYVGRSRAKGAERWRFDFFPLLAMGGGTDSSWWKLLYGLAGYERRGKYRRLHTFYIPWRLGE